MRCEESNLMISYLRSDEDVSDIAKLHDEAFSNVLIGQLGKWFTMAFYRQVLRSNRGCIVVCRDKEAVAGFAAGTASTKRLFDFSFYLVAALSCLVSVLIHPSIIVNMGRFIKRSMVSHSVSCPAELLSIVVAPGYRRRGIGKKLVGLFDACMRSQHVDRYKVFTDMEYSSGHRLYSALRFDLRKTLEFKGLTLSMYIRNLRTA